MKFSIVTISFNQGRFLETAIESVISQRYEDLEYILIDAGSTDGSRDIIERYRSRIDVVIFEPDNGPADGLNKGFYKATGEVFGFINSDDYLLPGALHRLARQFDKSPSADVISGHAIVVDEAGNLINRFRSRRFSLERYVYGAATIAQQSTFVRAAAFHRAGGFNSDNKIAWDGELWVDLALSGAKFALINEYLSAFRVYKQSISGSGGQHSDAHKDYLERMWRRVKRRPRLRHDDLIQAAYKFCEYTLDPAILLHRLKWGPTLPR